MKSGPKIGLVLWTVLSIVLCACLDVVGLILLVLPTMGSSSFSSGPIAVTTALWVLGGLTCVAGILFAVTQKLIERFATPLKGGDGAEGRGVAIYLQCLLAFDVFLLFAWPVAALAQDWASHR